MNIWLNKLDIYVSVKWSTTVTYSIRAMQNKNE